MARKEETKSRRGRGEGGLYQRADGYWVGTIDLGWVNGKHIRKTKTATTKTELLAKMKVLRNEIDKGGGLSEDSTVEAWLNHWLKFIVSERNRESTLEGYTSRVNTWLIPYLGKYRLSKLNQDHIRALYRVMKEQGSSDATRRRTHAVLHRALEVAIQDGRITRNPAAMMDPPPTKVNHRSPLSIEQAKQILSQLDGNPLAARWVAALLQGMRQGECLALTWDDVDFKKETIRIRQSQVRLKNQGLTISAPKSAASTRVIPMIAPMKYALEKTERRGDFIFYGVPKDAKADWNEWKKLLISTGVYPEGTPFGEMPALACGRPTTATLLRDAGVDATVIRDILGHSQVQVTQESYQRTDALTMKNAMKALEETVKVAARL